MSYGEENPRSTRYRPGGQQCEPSALATIRNGRQRARQAHACEKESEEYRQNTNDLIQQTRAADAAQAQANIASQQLWTGWLQTLGGLLTLAAAIGAAIYARDAASETKRSNELAQLAQSAAMQAIEDERAAKRPVITTDATANISGRFPPHYADCVQLQIRADGQTDAYEVTARCWVTVDGTGMENLELHRPEGAQMLTVRVNAMNSGFTWPLEIVSSEEQVLALDGRLIKMKVAVKYNDAFRQPHEFERYFSGLCEIRKGEGTNDKGTYVVHAAYARMIEIAPPAP